jgi:SagB-type dehydrogenase family enzyme
MRGRSSGLNAIVTDYDIFSLSALYHENSKLRQTNSRQYGEYISLVTASPYIAERMADSYKSYPTEPSIPLPTTLDNNPSDIVKLITQRRTRRAFTGQPITMVDLAHLLQTGYGITGGVPLVGSGEKLQLFRAAPSAGALYPLELYVAVWNVRGLSHGIYHYNVRRHSLEHMAGGDQCAILGRHTQTADFIQDATAMILMSAVFRRTMFKYQERGYRFILLEAGHVAQNLCLVAGSLDIGVLPIGAFLDDELNRLLGLDGVNESVLYPLLIGRIGT